MLSMTLFFHPKSWSDSNIRSVQAFQIETMGSQKKFNLNNKKKEHSMTFHFASIAPALTDTMTSQWAKRRRWAPWQLHWQRGFGCRSMKKVERKVFFVSKFLFDIYLYPQVVVTLYASLIFFRVYALSSWCLCAICLLVYVVFLLRNLFFVSFVLSYKARFCLNCAMRNARWCRSCGCWWHKKRPSASVFFAPKTIRSKVIKCYWLWDGDLAT